MAYTALTTEQRGSVLLVRINRPHISNKLSIQCMRELSSLLADKAADDAVCSVILAGLSDYFCSGGELGDFRVKDAMEVKQFGAAFIALHTDMTIFPKPIIAAVEGDALGGGFSLVEACDLAVSADSAAFAIPEMLDGLAPAMGLSGLYANLTKKQIMSLGLLGTRLTADQALACGMLNHVVPKDKVIDKAFEIGRFFADKSPTAVRLFKELYADMGFMDYEKRLRLGQSMMLALFKSKDGAEVLDCKEQNRAPAWSNSGR